jgi:hypothetical protein
MITQLENVERVLDGKVPLYEFKVGDKVKLRKWIGPRHGAGPNAGDIGIVTRLNPVPTNPRSFEDDIIEVNFKVFGKYYLYRDRIVPVWI